MDSEQLLALAALAEASERGDRWLDEHIALAVIGGFVRVETSLGMNGRTPGRNVWRVMGKARPIPKFTASLDAAIGLVPKGYQWTVAQARVGSGAMVCPDNRDADCPNLMFAATPALALLAASLRALAASMKDGTHVGN